MQQRRGLGRRLVRSPFTRVDVLEGRTGRTGSYNNNVSICKYFGKAVVDAFVAFDDLVGHCLVRGYFWEERGSCNHILALRECGRDRRPRRLLLCDRRAPAHRQKDLSGAGD